MRTTLISVIIFFVVIFILPTTVLAHVTVSPKEVAIGTRQNFIVTVPNEKDIPTVAVRLVIPEGVASVSPYAKAGWRVDISHEENDAEVTEINWTAGQIDVGLRDEFVFRAMVPKQETKLAWKAYQTYADGTVVAWDMDPANGTSDDGDVTPYSTTEVINDLVSAEDNSELGLNATIPTVSLMLSALSLIIAIAALHYSRRA